MVKYRSLNPKQEGGKGKTKMNNYGRQSQKLSNDDNGVSPVIGVILMVAITVVLAAVVFVLVQKLAQPTEVTPTLTFNKNVTDKTLTVIDTNRNIAWSDLNISGCDNTNTGNVTAGQTLSNCSGTISIAYTPTNTLIYTTVF